MRTKSQKNPYQKEQHNKTLKHLKGFSHEQQMDFQPFLRLKNNQQPPELVTAHLRWETFFLSKTGTQFM